MSKTAKMNKKNLMQAIMNPAILIQLFLGFAGGLPLLLIGSTLQAWLKDDGVDLATIGFLSIVGLPYTLKFLWSPFLDRYAPPILDRRRGWMAISQVALAILFALLSITDPAQNKLGLFLIGGLIAFASATQDILIDAYRREILTDEELGLGSSLYVGGYRIALLVSGAAALIMASSMPWPKVYLIMSLIMVMCLIFTIFAPKVSNEVKPPAGLKEAFVGPFMDFFTREGALLILVFILLYKVGDSMAGNMSMPLYLDQGYTKIEVGTIAKGIGMFATIGGGILGGILMMRMTLNHALWIFGGLQMISTAGFAFLAVWPKDLILLSGVIGFENLCAGLGTVAYMTFMASLTNKKFTATQYALLSSLMGVPRVVFSSFTGLMVESMGYPQFFIFCTLIAIPGMLLLIKFAPWNGNNSRPVQTNS